MMHLFVNNQQLTGSNDSCRNSSDITVETAVAFGDGASAACGDSNCNYE